MAVLSDADRQVATRAFVRQVFVQMANTATLDHTDLKAAVDATDSWIDTNAAAYNLTLPTAARTTLTATQKTLLFCYVALRRAGL